MNGSDNETIRERVREDYGSIARNGGSCAPACCAGPGTSARLGYSEDELAAVPEGADLGLGCGNPHAVAGLREGDIVLDLGSGAGFDAFVAARRVGPTGRVIGVDMTADMIRRARENARQDGTENVEFRLGEIESLPVSDGSVDVILSNCVINLSPEKARVFAEAFRVLKPGGKLAISDVVLTAALPPEMAASAELLTGCVAGAAPIADIERWLSDAGFERVEVRVNPSSREVVSSWFPGSGAEDYVASATIEGFKPSAESCCAPSCCS